MHLLTPYRVHRLSCEFECRQSSGEDASCSFLMYTRVYGGFNLKLRPESAVDSRNGELEKHYKRSAISKFAFSASAQVASYVDRYVAAA